MKLAADRGWPFVQGHSSEPAEVIVVPAVAPPPAPAEESPEALHPFLELRQRSNSHRKVACPPGCMLARAPAVP